MTSPRTARVVGGGIIGLNVALALQERGLRVSLSNLAGDERPASWGNAGHIATEQVEPLASWRTLRSLPKRLFMVGGPVSLPLGSIGAWLPFGLRLMRAAAPARLARGAVAMRGLLAAALPAWERRVSAMHGTHLLGTVGHIVAWGSEASARRGREVWANTDTGTATWRDVSAHELRAMHTLMRYPPAAAIRFEGTARVVDPGDALAALGDAFAKAGGERIEAEAALTPAWLERSDVTVVCAGAASGDLLRPLGHAVPIIAERGYHIQSRAATWPVELPPIVFEDRAVVATGFRSGLRLTSFVEYAHRHAPADPRKWQRLRAHAAALGLPMSDGVTQWMGARPTLPDYLPAIGRSHGARNLYYAFGHQHLGLTLGPITGEIVADLVVGAAPKVDISAFALERFES
jgi:D-hydroxyproline dehydrogenase